MLQRTLCLVKPDGVERRLVGQILTRLENKGFRIVAMRMLKVDNDLAQRHYAEHVGKPFFGGLIDHITSGPLVALCLEGNDAVAGLRGVIGNTNPTKAAAGTIRGDFALTMGRNIIHAADSPEAAEREIALFFAPQDLIEHEPVLHRWIHRED